MTQAGESPADRRIGLLFIHGVGEQQAFHHLSAECENLVRELRTDPRVGRLAVHTETTRDGSFGATQQTWCADQKAPVRIDFTYDGKPLTLECHEVWWADLDDDETLWNTVRFWIWGLGQWGACFKEADASRLGALKMRPPKAPKRKFAGLPTPRWLWIRVQLFFVGMYFFLVLVTLTLANFLLSKLSLGRLPGSRVIVQYVGDVKLYQQERWRRQMPPLSDLRHSPRVGIRRRVVSAMVQMALQGYERWYVCAHSLGTVVAYNGLMETAHCLPNYLTKSTWERCKGKLGGRLPKPVDTSKMLPARPIWLEDEDTIDRQKLFERLGGLFTYGSPLDKFAALWPKIVPVNDEQPFASTFQWINVYDPTDAIAGGLQFLEPRPKNFAYRAHRALLYSHLRYLRPTPASDGGKDDSLKTESDTAARLLLHWVAEGQSFPKPTPTDPSWLSGPALFLRHAWALVQAVTYFGILATLGTWITVRALTALLAAAAEHLPPWMSTLQAVLTAFGTYHPRIWHLVAIAFVATLLAGALVRLAEPKE